ncbi:SusC/RagA family TonB-linked outer membrane protein [Pedobacter hartonius]|uniref:TonB-linked outer membrane protein, SusC/RagA family n=1 Tax=Pedobacter hartonius TaxID=425514 RepID=A0A1H4BX30_9SPHI|nr:SusC/RagA family TonB-linked outer membrane protein [Pedobacter hartonius]SEA52639.1 TonB-linked outer membrane protein, SusC/RagA family [Pedobacter hartonius]
MKNLVIAGRRSSYACKILLLLQITILMTCGSARQVYALTSKTPQALRINIKVRGRIVDEDGNGIAGAVIKIKDGKTTVLSDLQGYFWLLAVDDHAVLTISHLGFQQLEMRVKKDLGEIRMKESYGQLNEVGIVSTGYQSIPKERATGSFVLIDSALLNRKVSTNILDRLDGVTSGLIFNRNKTGNTPYISVRGRSTIASDANPLIILDNFPYDGDISNINPQDVKSVTVLKDGAASSIWGSRAGNGVIVITTYKGVFNQKPMVTLNSNVTIGGRPDLYYRPQLTNQQFIGIEQFLFDKGAYNTVINNGYSSLSPAVEIMLQNRKGTITEQRKSALLDSIAMHDNRDDLKKYYYRPSVNQQYQLSVNGGGANNKYYVSMGYDKNQANTVINSNDRISLNASNTVSMLNNKLEVVTGIMFTASNANVDGTAYTPQFPYENLADQNGNALAITKTLRLPYVDTVGKGRLLDWHYKPLDEIRNPSTTQRSRLTDYRINVGLSYEILKSLRLSGSYTYDKGVDEQVKRNTLASYYTRDIINTYSQINQATGVVTYPVPLGEIADNSSRLYYSHYARGQLNYEKLIAGKHAVNAIGGIEVKDYQSKFNSFTLYGFDNETLSNKNNTINPTVLYPGIYGFNSSRIPLNIANASTIDRYRSYFFNGSYTYNDRYILSASARKDESNLFGVKTNQKGVPLWSAGLAWNISNESFYHFDQLTYLKLRATYGYSGNVNKSVSAYLTAQAMGLNNLWNVPYVTITNPPNPSLRWEQVRNINLGLDFQTRANVLSGSVEYWIKSGFDLIGTSPIAQQTGVSSFTGNTASMRGQGVDVTLNSNNLKVGGFSWSAQFHFNYNTDKITDYKVKAVDNGSIVNNNFMSPVIGRSYYAVFSYRWRGLDNQGNPQAVLNGVTSTNYPGITNSTNINDLEYNGTLTPKYYGNIMNNISWKAFQLSFNIVYKLGYVFRRASLSSSSVYAATVYGASRYQQEDYEQRWQKPGDELLTSVPALVYPVNSSRDAVYSSSSALIEKGDHIRLQDLRLGYSPGIRNTAKAWLKHLTVFAYASNLGILWKATGRKVDPDYSSGIPLPKTLAIGFKGSF